MTTTKPIEDTDLWGVDTENKHADYWPFGHLLVGFEKLAEENRIDWPLKTPWQWRNIGMVKAAMEDTFSRLPQSDKEAILGEYETFLRLDNSFDWVGMAENRNKHTFRVYLLWGEYHQAQWMGSDHRVYRDGEPIETVVQLTGNTRAEAAKTLDTRQYEFVED